MVWINLPLVSDSKEDFSWECLMLLQSSLLLGNWCPLVYMEPMAVNYLTSSQSTKRHQKYSTRLYAWLHIFIFFSFFFLFSTFVFDTHIHEITFTLKYLEPKYETQQELHCTCEMLTVKV